MSTRREFLKQALASTAAVSLGGLMPGLTPKSYAAVQGANDRIRAGMIGVNSRGLALSESFSKQDNCVVSHVCDVDSRALQKCVAEVEKAGKGSVKGFVDVRKMLEDKDFDIAVIATPDHWHAPGALMAMQAGKDVYLEKPCSHSPHEGELLVQAAARYRRLIQMGNQRRSWPNVIEGISQVKSGAIGRVYFGKSWYTANRAGIGRGKEVPAPEWLDWNLWQGPAPRRAYKDNIVHYNWHWLWHWGTGEALNNGTHMVDILRWGLEEDFPVKIESTGGRYFPHNDDWECPDTQVIAMEFADGKAMTWEGRSCNGLKVEGDAVGAIFYGEKGSLMITSGNSYTQFDLDGKEVRKVEGAAQIDARNRMNPTQVLDTFHIQNFFDGIRKGATLHADIVSGHKSTALVQLGNISQRVNRSLTLDPLNGHIQGDRDAQALWSREYEPGWEMKV